MYDALDKLQARKADLIYLQPSADIETINEIAELHGRHPGCRLCSRAPDRTKAVCSMPGVQARRTLSTSADSTSLDASLQHGARGALLRKHRRKTLPTQARFFFLDESGKEETRKHISSPFTIGRSHGNDLILSHSGVSRLHRRSVGQNRQHLLRDLNSKLGTYLNGVRVEQAKLSSATGFSLADLSVS
jgi:hypothetical protein